MWQWKTRHDPDCLRALMFRFWKMLLITCAVVGVVSIGIALWTIFVPLRLPTPSAPVGQDATEALSREQLRTVLDLFTQKKLEHANRRAAPANIADPAL